MHIVHQGATLGNTSTSPSILVTQQIETDQIDIITEVNLLVGYSLISECLIISPIRQTVETSSFAIE
jgi:hypothetical protein